MCNVVTVQYICYAKQAHFFYENAYLFARNIYINLKKINTLNIDSILCKELSETLLVYFSIT